MSPPNVPGVPGTKLPPPHPAREEARPRQQSHHDRRAEPTNPPPSELAPDSGPAYERVSRVEQEDFRRDVHASYGKASFRGPAWVFGIVALIALCIGGTYYIDHREPGATDAASKADLNALDKHVSDLAQSVKDLSSTISRNADQAHNDTQNVATELHSYINSHAR